MKNIKVSSKKNVFKNSGWRIYLDKLQAKHSCRRLWRWVKFVVFKLRRRGRQRSQRFVSSGQWRRVPPEVPHDPQSDGESNIGGLAISGTQSERRGGTPRSNRQHFKQGCHRKQKASTSNRLLKWNYVVVFLLSWHSEWIKVTLFLFILF